MATPEAVLDALRPIARAVSLLDLSDPADARRQLDEVWPIDHLSELRALLEEARDEGWLTPRRATPELTFGRLAKPSADTSDQSIDVVDMSGAGGAHTHPRGEVSLCFAQGGQPLFCGEPAGWVVVGPHSHHVPEVTGGRMLIVYFLPGGAIEFSG